MRLLKMLGLAAIAAVAAMAFVGVGSASAEEKTVLCTNETHPCAEGRVLPAQTPINASLQSGTKSVLKLQNFPIVLKENVECQISQIGGKTKEEKGQPQLEGQIERLTFEACTESGFGTECVVTALQLSYQTLLSQENPNDQNGKMSVFEKPTQIGQPGFKVECPLIPMSPIVCDYKVAELNKQVPGKEVANLQVTGGNPAKISAEQVQMKEQPEPGQELCPGEEPKWDAQYDVTEPNPMFVSHVFQPVRSSK